MCVHFTRYGRAVLCAATLLAASTAHATVLVPGGTVVPAVLGGPAGALEASAINLALNTGDVQGSLTAAVVRNAGGTLDFYYQITNALGSMDSLSRNTNSLFATLSTLYDTSVFYRTDTGGLGIFSVGDAGATPLTAERNMTGRVVGFNFLSLPGVTGIDPGETSRILVIRTNAVDFTAGMSSVIDGGVDSVDTFAPTGSPVPEPASLLLLSSAFAAAAYVARHRGGTRRKPARG
jgi:hypothetical protein